jgi:hypothetical protein
MEEYKPPKKITQMRYSLLSDEINVACGMLNANQYIGQKGTVDTEGLYGALKGTIGTDVLPRNLLWISRDQRSLIIAQPAEKRTIKFQFGKQGVKNLKTIELELDFPMLFMGINRAAGDKYQIQSVFSTAVGAGGAMTPFPFWNIFKTGNVCTYFAQDYDATGLSISDQVDVAVDLFWNSTFNTEVKDLAGRQFIKSFNPKSLNLDMITKLGTLMIKNRHICPSWTNTTCQTLQNSIDWQSHADLIQKVSEMVDTYHLHHFGNMKTKNSELGVGSLLGQSIAMQVYVPMLVWHIASIDPEFSAELVARNMKTEVNDGGYSIGRKDFIRSVLRNDDNSVEAARKQAMTGRVATSTAKTTALFNRVLKNTIAEPLEVL